MGTILWLSMLTVILAHLLIALSLQAKTAGEKIEVTYRIELEYPKGREIVGAE